MEEELINIKNTALSFILETDDLKTLEEIKLQFLGRSGKLTIAIKEIPRLPSEKRPEIGMLANDIKQTLEETIEQKKIKIKGETLKKQKGKIDITAPGIQPSIGSLHPMSQVLYEVVEVFKSLGFQAADAPEIETDYYNFEVLNIPKDHPARDTQQTPYLDTRHTYVTPGEIILRTQTSAMQGRVMQKIKPSLRVIVPGKSYRYEQIDASHGFEF